MEDTKLNYILNMVTDHVPRIVVALVVLVVGLWAIKWVTKFATKAMDKSSVDKVLQPFLRSMVSILLKVLLLFSVAGMMGIETASFVAVLAAAGFAIGFALQGSLSNFAAGVMVLIFKPYRVDDLIEIEDEVGHVREIQLFNTIMETEDHHMVIIPNNKAIDDKIKNYTSLGFRRVDLSISMGYEASFPHVKEILTKAILETPHVMAEPLPTIGIEGYDTHFVNLAVRPYAETEHYWDVYFACNAAMKKALSEAGIKMAYSEGVELGPIGS